MVRDDGLVLIRRPLTPDSVESNLTGYPLFTRYLIHTPRGGYVATSPLDRERRFVRWKLYPGALADARDQRVSAAARHALATLREVSESGAAIRGELPFSENTEVRGFARRAYEAIMVPELELEVEAEA